MVVLRRTQKLAPVLPLTTSDAPEPDTALGDWYVNRLSVDRKPLLLLVSSRALLPLVIPAREVGRLADRLADLVEGRLRRLGVPAVVARAETRAMVPVAVGRTLERSVVGVMVDFAKAIPFYLTAGAWDETSLPFVESRLAETPCHAGRRFEAVVFPEKKAPELLFARWGAG